MPVRRKAHFARKPTPRGVNPIDLELFRHTLLSIAEEMGVVLRKTSFSSNIKERRDYSCAVYDSHGETLAMGDHMPVHLGAMPMAVSYALADFQLQPGDVVILNDPFRGGTHLPDITAVRGVFCSGKTRPDFYVANRAHHADIGGMTPGSMGLAREIYQEGLRIPPIKIVSGGAIDQHLLRLITANVRTPEERRGDLLAQFMSLERCDRRLAEVQQRWGRAAVRRLGSALLDYSERRMRAVVSSIPDGAYHFEDYLDDDGVSAEPLKISVSITIRGSSATVDFSGSSPQAAGPMNANLAVTTAAVAYAFRCLIQDDVPFTAGLFRPLTIIAPSGSVVNALPPAAMAAGNVETSQRITDVLLGALAEALPGSIPAASSGTMTNVTFGGWDSARNAPFAYYETVAGGMGASALAHGISGVHTHMTNSWNTPVEAFERLYPVRIRSYHLRPESGGDGRERGGDGIIREYEFLGDADATLLSDRRTHPPYGLDGGESGSPGRAVLIRGQGKTPIAAKARFAARAGDILRIETPGGGGFGTPSPKGARTKLRKSESARAHRSGSAP
jgi:N-methylhydantoinase B/oxoprolinase/acetone carboxylase alpha subunit